MILKSQEYRSAEDITIFVSKNAIQRENIVSITVGSVEVSQALTYCIFFYGEPEVKEITKGLWGWDKK